MNLLESFFPYELLESRQYMHMPSCNSGASLGCTILAKVYYWVHHVFQEPHLGVLHLLSSVLYILWCKSGASLWCTVFANSVLHMPSCTSGATLGCTTLAIKCTTEGIMYFRIRSLTWGYCICHQVYCICHHVFQKPHFCVLHLTSSVLH